MAKNSLIPQGKQFAMGAKTQVSVPTGGGLAKQMKAPAKMMKPAGGTKPSSVPNMKGMGTKVKGKF